jgi:hypothetical protein
MSQEQLKNIYETFDNTVFRYKGWLTQVCYSQAQGQYYLLKIKRD